MKQSFVIVFVLFVFMVAAYLLWSKTSPKNPPPPETPPETAAPRRAGDEPTRAMLPDTSTTPHRTIGELAKPQALRVVSTETDAATHGEPTRAQTRLGPGSNPDDPTANHGKRQDTVPHTLAPPTVTKYTPTLNNADDDDADPLQEMVWSADKSGIQSAMREITPAIRECYDGWIQDNREMQGKLVVKFTIGADPGADEAKVQSVNLPESELGNPLMEGCVLNAVSGLRFDVPDDGNLTVNYPFRFSAQENIIVPTPPSTPPIQ